MRMKRRAEQRRKKMKANRAEGFEEAEKWDLDFWQSQSPQERLSALVAIRRDLQKIDNPKHKEDVRVLREVKKRRRR